MQPSDDNNQFLKSTYAAARDRFKPASIETLLVAEAPCESLDRYFYFEDVKKQDTLFLQIMHVLYPEQKQRYMKSRRQSELKADLLRRFQEDGYWLMDLSEIPKVALTYPIENCVHSLVDRVGRQIDKNIPIILIKTNVFDICYNVLKSEGYNVINIRMPFPGSGQQNVFQESFTRALELR